MNVHKEGVVYGVIGSALLSALVLIGSRRLAHFDAALLPYLFATLFAVFGTIYRYAVWLSRPPTQRLWKRSLHFVFSKSFPRNIRLIIKAFIHNMLLQRFIGKRSHYRWILHFLLAWGCLIAFSVTFPLVFGWLHFQTPIGQPDLYQVVIFGFPATIFNPYSVFGFLIFNALNFCSAMIIIGTIMAFTRRFLNPGEMTTQTFSHDLLPLLILFSVAATGLFLTYSTHFLEGQHYRALSMVHCWTVVLFLIYLPFGKFFHIFQRAAQMGAILYIQEKENGTPALCLKSSEPFTSHMQKEDVKRTLRELGFQFQTSDDGPSIQDLSPLARRQLLMATQHQRLKGRFDIDHS